MRNAGGLGFSAVAHSPVLQHLAGPCCCTVHLVVTTVPPPPVLQVTGQPSVLYYAGKIFEAAGFAGGSEAARVSVLLGTFKLLMTLVAVATVDKWGRRPLLLTGDMDVLACGLWMLTYLMLALVVTMHVCS